MKHLRHIMLVISLICSIAAKCQTCNIQGTEGTDFWVTFILNSTNSPVFSFIATGPNNATITVNNPLTGYTQTYTHTAGTKNYMELPGGNQNIPSAVASNRGYHITATAPIFLFVSNYIRDSWGIANVLPTEALGSNYIVQDYANNSNFPPTVAMVASQDSTQVTFAIPTAVEGMSTSQVGVPTTFTLNAGQSLMLKSQSTVGFDNMEITSDKPIAVFQGHSCQRVGTSNGGRDQLLEQARPLNMWGNEFIVMSTMNRTEGDVIMVTAGDDNCVVNLNGSVIANLQRGMSCTHTLPSSTGAARITTSQPAYVCMYTWSYDNGRTLGDPSSVSINPVSRWICTSDFPVHNCNPDIYDELYIIDNHHYINICATAEAMDSLRLDGQLVTGAQPITGGYKYVRRNITPGSHSISSPNGTFFAHVYGCGKWVQYNFELGLAIDNVQDTVDIYDTICQGTGYDTLGLTLQPAQTQTMTIGTFTYERNYRGVHYVFHMLVLPTANVNIYDSISLGDTMMWNDIEITSAGEYSVTLTSANGCDSTVTLHIMYMGSTMDIYDTVCAGTVYSNYGFTVNASTACDTTIVRDTVEGGAPKRYILHLTVHPTNVIEINEMVVVGDTIAVCDTMLSVAGDYVFQYTNVYGCDSVVTVHLTYEPVGLHASKDGVCPGEEVVLTATGTHTFIWSANPPDAEVDAQQGQNPIIVHPTQTTVYSLMDDGGNAVSSVTIGTEPPPTLCVEVNRDILDFDHPVLLYTDCSDGRRTTYWLFADGHHFTGEKVRRRFEYPLPDSAVVTMTSCNRYNCCADTVIAIPMKINSVWFPNIFMPGADNNNLFQCFTSMDVAVFELAIYDRWGILVWSSEDVNQPWDGRNSDGTPCPQGAYAYRYYLKATDNTLRHGIGTVTVIR